MTDAELVHNARGGDAECAEQLVKRHHANCWRFALHMLADREDAEDVVQETFFRAFRSLDRYVEQHRFEAWLFRILANECKSVFERRRRAARMHAPGGEDYADCATTDVVDFSEQDEAERQQLGLQAALAELSEDAREAFLLKHGEGMEYTEIARLTGASVSALKMRVKRATEQLRGTMSRMTIFDG